MCSAFDLELERHLEQARRARIARVEAMAEAGRRLAGVDAAAATISLGGLAVALPPSRTSSSPASRNCMQLSMSPPW